MKYILQSAKAIFFKLGERSAIILVILSSLFLLYSETATEAYSQEQQVVFKRVEGNWYEKEVGLKTAQPIDEFAYSFTTGKVTPTPSPSPAPAVISSDNSDIWEKLALCESKGNWGINTGNGYYGGLQFSESAWRSVGGSGLPHENSRDEQIMRGKMLQEKRGWGPWGACSKKLGLL
jgi:hypothetical protein